MSEGDLVEPQKDTILAQEHDVEGGGVEHEHRHGHEEGAEEDAGLPHEVGIEYGLELEEGLEHHALDHPDAEFPQYDITAYRWQQNGRKISKVSEKTDSIRRQHWRCSNWDKPTKEKGCKAKYRIDIYTNGKAASEPFKNEVPHNHLPPPERGRVDMETQLQQAVNPSKREKGRNTPSKRSREEDDEGEESAVQQEPAKVELEQQIAAINSVIKLFESYGDHFVRKVDLFPETRATFASPKGLADLIKHQNEPVFVSSDYIALGLTLHIFTIVDAGVENTVLWLITNTRTTQTYEHMLRYVSEDLLEGNYKPTSMYVGFDQAFREALSKVFPTCDVLTNDNGSLLNITQQEDLATSLIPSETQ